MKVDLKHVKEVVKWFVEYHNEFLEDYDIEDIREEMGDWCCSRCNNQEEVLLALDLIDEELGI